MRRQIRPFTVERKRNARAPAPETPESGIEKDSSPAPLAPEPPQPLLAPKKTDAPRWAAAEALFSTPAPAAAAAPSPASAPGAGRILPSLDEPAPVLHPSYDVDEAPKRRGRKPGSRNKPRNMPRDPQQGPKTIGTVMRDLFEFWAKEDAENGDARTSEPPAAAPDGAAPAPLALRRRGRAVRDELPRGQRWKARLPRFAR